MIFVIVCCPIPSYVMYEELYFAAAVLLQEPVLKPHLIFLGNFIYLLKYSTDGSKAIISILGCNYDADKISNVWPMSVVIVMRQHSLLYLQTETLYFL